MADPRSALRDILSQIAEQPYDVTLHAQHIQLAQSSPDLVVELQSALEMMSTFMAAEPEHVWLPLIQLKEASLDLDTAAGIEELFSIFELAEGDYLSIPLLQKHLGFITAQYEKYNGEDKEMKPTDLGDLFSVEWTREAIQQVVAKGLVHLTQSHLLWDVQRDWELEVLAATPDTEQAPLVDHVEELLLARLRQPHSNHEETFQTYSSFTTNYKPPSEYESLLLAASKSRTQAVRAYERREQHEAILRQSPSPEAYAAYVASERRAKYPDLFIIRGVYERAITDCASRRFKGEAGAEEALRLFWTGYLDALRINGVYPEDELHTAKRAVRGVPASGEVWARYMRLLERLENTNVQQKVEEEREEVHAIFIRALETKALQRNVEQLVPVVLARAGYERRKIESGRNDEDSLATLIGILEGGIEMMAKASKTGDPRLRLEKCLADVYERLVQMPEGAISTWEAATKRHKSSYLVWTTYTETLIKYQRYDEARSTFSDICMKNIDWSEAIWEAWVSFEQLHGSVDDIEACLDKVEKAQYQVNARRAKEAEKAGYQMQLQVQAGEFIQDAVSAASGTAGNASEAASNAAVGMDVDVRGTQPENRGTKRTAEEEFPAGEASKKVKTAPKLPPLKRDRENCTVFVAGLPADAVNDDLKHLFKDCGDIREVKITTLPDALVATVEFEDRDSIPAALTKDKKRIHGHEIAVHLAWKSTLYVTNFPESTDDAFMRNLFGQYGPIFDVRWPSKKFKATRRFCYVQFASPAAADAALELHNRELQPGLPINVYISNPERKKERTDHGANEREIYVAGLSKFATRADLEKVFRTYGKIKDIRMASEEEGHAKGYAFVEYEDADDARAALAANNYELKKRRIAVTLADPRVRARHKNIGETGLSRTAEVRQRSVRIRGLPPNTQEGLLQQTLEKVAAVQRVEVFEDKHEAVAEFESAAEAGKMLLRTEPIIFNGYTLRLGEEGRDESSVPAAKAGGMFVPRKAGSSSRPRAGLGHASRAGPRGSSSGGGTAARGQDDFRKMLS